MDTEIQAIEVGKPFFPAIGAPEGTQLHIGTTPGDDCIQFLSYFISPSEEELRDYKNGAVKMRLFIEDDLLFLLFKVGSQNWCDVPFEPRLHKSFGIETAPDNKGYPLLLILADVPSGIVKQLRLIGLSTEFSRVFKLTVDKLNSDRGTFSKESYSRKLDLIQNKYSSDEMAQKAIFGFEFK